MEVQRIKTEGRRIDDVRTVERLWLALTTKSENGCTIQGHLVRPGPEPVRIEIYADRLGAVLERVRTDAHRAAYAQAVKMHEAARDEECHARDLKPGSDLGMKWNGAPELHLGILGYRSGLPPLETCEVVHPRTGATMDARAWHVLPDEQQREWLVDAPVTPLNASQLAAESMAETLKNAFAVIAQNSAQASQDQRKQR